MSEQNSSKLVPFLVTIIVLLVAILAFMLGRASGGEFGWFMRTPMMGDHHQGAGGEPFNDDNNRMGPSMMGPAEAGALSGADVMFLQMMIPHHQQAVDMSDLALEKSSNAQLRAIANAIKVGQTKEIVQMRQWLSDNGASETSGMPSHHGMGMGGMLSDSAMSRLRAATGTEFDRLWLEGMIAHHEGALHMVTMIDDSQNAELAAFAASIKTVQSAEIAQMKALL